MDFNYILLEETRETIKNMMFFREEVEINQDKYEVIHDLEQALDNAFCRFYKYGEYEGHTWVDILEEKMAEVWEIIYQHENYAELSEVVSDIEIPELIEIEYTIDADSVQAEIEAELELCAISRFICGKNNDFFESIFEVYCIGGWPCGWNDEKLIVYIPSKVKE